MPNDSPELIDLRAHRHAAQPSLLNDFIALYLRTFTDPAEREDPSQWAERLEHDLPEPQPRMHLLVAAEPGTGPNRVHGGLAFEYYRGSRCGLYTYLVVDPDRQRGGLAKAMLARAIEILKADARDHGEHLRAVFAESENPALVAADNNSMAPRDRLVALSRLGARWIDIPYVQPTLIGGSERCRHLFLLAFHHGGADPQAIEGAVVRDFLHEFYRALGVEQPDSDVDFLDQQSHIGAHLPLKPIPTA
jgi:GNAT superfamily N-acetyltransferase